MSQVRTRLAAGGRWIRIIGPRSEHPPIIDHPLGDAVQAQLAGKVAQRNEGGRTLQPRP
jgi:hypothetical protein